MRPYQLATAAALIAIAAVAMYDSRSGAVLGADGIGAGFWPFWSSALMAVTALVVVYRTVRVPQPAEGPFAGSQGVRDVLLLIVPMVVAIALMDKPVQLGFYIVSAAYMAFFMRFVGRYRWHWSVAAGLIVSVALFVIFEQGFRVPLPKSRFYEMDILPF